MSILFSDISFSIILIAILVGLIAGFIDAVAGGGGLITVPALLLFGLSPIESIATNKFQGSFGTLSASITMIKNKKTDLNKLRVSILTCAIGAIIGSILVQYSPAEALTVLIPIIVLLIGLYFLFAPSPGEVETKPRVSVNTWRYKCVPLMGFYDGYLGPGAGMFYTLGGVALRGKEIISATADAKVLNFISNIVSLFIFILSGKVVWVFGLLMIIGQFIGAYLGAMATIKGGFKFIRPIIVVTCFAMLIKYAIDTFS